MSDNRKFEYLLNAMEYAGQQENPAEHGYRQKREAVFAYVHDLEYRASKLAQLAQDLAAFRPTPPFVVTR
jgi:hypothetical protein